MSDASGLPTPKTTFFRELARCGHLRHTSARARSSANAAALASETGAAATSVGAGGDAGAMFVRAIGAEATGTTAAGAVRRGAWARAAKFSGETETKRVPRLFKD